MIEQFGRLLDPLKSSIKNLALKALVRIVDDSKDLQQLQVEVFEGEPIDGVERMQNYGFCSSPEDGAEALLLNLGGNWNHPIVVVTDDRRYRPKNMAPGEVRVFHKSGQYISIKDSGISINAIDRNGDKHPVSIEASSLKITADGKSFSLPEFIQSFNTHTHNSNGAGTPVKEI